MSHWEAVCNAREFHVLWNALCRYIGALVLTPERRYVPIAEIRREFLRCAEYHGGIMESGRLDVSGLQLHHGRQQLALIHAGAMDDAGLMRYEEQCARKKWKTFSVAMVAGESKGKWVFDFLESSVHQVLGEILLCLLLNRVPWPEAGITDEALLVIREELQERLSRCSD